MFWRLISCHKSQHSNKCSSKELFLNIKVHKKTCAPVETCKIILNLDNKFSVGSMGKRKSLSMPILKIFESNFSCKYGFWNLIKGVEVKTNQKSAVGRARINCSLICTLRHNWRYSFNMSTMLLFWNACQKCSQLKSIWLWKIFKFVISLFNSES